MKRAHRRWARWSWLLLAPCLAAVMAFALHRAAPEVINDSLPPTLAAP